MADNRSKLIGLGLPGKVTPKIDDLGAGDVLEWDATTGKWVISALTGVAAGTVTGNVLYWNGTAWVETDAVSIDPIGVTTLKYNGLDSLTTQVNGVRVVDTSGSEPMMGLASDTGFNIGVLQFAGTTMYLESRIHGGPVVIRGEDVATGASKNILLGDPDLGTDLYYNGTKTFGTLSTGAEVVGTTLDLDNSAAATQAALLVRNSEGGVKFLADGDTFSITQTDSTGAGEDTWVKGNNNGSVDLYYDNTVAAKSLSTGISVHGESTTAEVGFRTSADAEIGFLKVTSTDMIMRSEGHGSNVRLQGEDAGGTNRSIFIADPDGQLSLWHAGVQVAHTADTEFQITRHFSLGTFTELTIAGGVVTTSQSFHSIDTQSNAATDNLDTITARPTGTILVLRSAVSARDTTLRDGVGNLRLAGNFTLTSFNDIITLISQGTTWAEVCRSNNA